MKGLTGTLSFRMAGDTWTDETGWSVAVWAPVLALAHRRWVTLGNSSVPYFPPLHHCSSNSTCTVPASGTVPGVFWRIEPASAVPWGWSQMQTLRPCPDLRRQHVHADELPSTPVPENADVRRWLGHRKGCIMLVTF